MAEQSDIWHAAGLLLEQNGAEAPSIAKRRIEELERQGDQVGAANWRLILDAIEELSAALID